MQIVNKEALLREHEGFLLAAKLSQMSPAFLQNSWATMEESILQNICCLYWWKLETISCCFLASTCSHQQRRSSILGINPSEWNTALKKRWPHRPQPARLAGSSEFPKVSAAAHSVWQGVNTAREISGFMAVMWLAIARQQIHQMPQDWEKKKKQHMEMVSWHRQCTASNH